MKGHTKGIRGLVLSRDDSLLYTFGLDGQIGVWRTKERILLKFISGHKAVFGGVLSDDQ
jgi:WD40 repeat protein